MTKLRNVHCKLNAPPNNGNSTLVQGQYEYYNYKCDGFEDVGWGCGYRTLQSICSGIILSRKLDESKFKVPTIPEIQEVLVQLEDKPAKFLGSRDWIGTLEASYVIDQLFDVPCKLIHINKRDHIRNHVQAFENYFKSFNGLIMMGGNLDAASKGIAGIHKSGNDIYLLVVDPHFYGIPKSEEELISQHYVKWQNVDDFNSSSFYNLCLPQLKAVN